LKTKQQSVWLRKKSEKDEQKFNLKLYVSVKRSIKTFFFHSKRSFQFW
jgi:hypothetical protein